VGYAASQAGGLYTSWDGGAHWTRAALPVPEDSWGAVRVLDVVAHPLDARVAFVVVASPSAKPRPMIYQTRDGGSNWRAESGLGATRVTALGYDATGDGLYLTTPSGLYQALGQLGQEEAFASSLSELQQGYLANLDVQQPVIELVAARWDAADADRMLLFLGTQGRGVRIFAVQQGRAELVPVSQGNVSQYVREQARVYAICVHNLRPGFVCVATERGLFGSMDGGASWFATANALRRESPRALVLDAQADVIYAGLAGGGAYLSRDSGATWNRLGRGISSLTVYDLGILAAPDGQRYLLAATNDGLWRMPLRDVVPAS
jgi:photosystem II stability/assembly factor-like uncharacterized protein